MKSKEISLDILFYDIIPKPKEPELSLISLNNFGRYITVFRYRLQELPLTKAETHYLIKKYYYSFLFQYPNYNVMINILKNQMKELNLIIEERSDNINTTVNELWLKFHYDLNKYNTIYNMKENERLKLLV